MGGAFNVHPNFLISYLRSREMLRAHARKDIPATDVREVFARARILPRNDSRFRVGPRGGAIADAGVRGGHRPPGRAGSEG